MGQNKGFKFYPRCKKLGVMHICFADDLLMFCKADTVSIQLLQGVFQRFSIAAGLQDNIEKSHIYLVGVKTALKQEILTTLGYLEGSIPFNYLGVPLSSKKMTFFGEKEINSDFNREGFKMSQRGIDRPSSGYREHHKSSIGDGDKWSKTPRPHMPRRKFYPGLGYRENAMDFTLQLHSLPPKPISG
ncbi:hypothetical protein MTR67_023663 [Solanum verrucosum]|uniref:Reverse transcriptase domain-containing protein n=1 Tax=Solanum verrucosum TaxID=315347 RepID=A0AAF0TYQ1_SOLVR|nr:hypothetical protein MTR67_023663 [Solanum verrucosum]